MVRFADLPPYCQRNEITQYDYDQWMKNIDCLKKNLIQPRISDGSPTFDNTLPIEFQRVKNEIVHEFPSLVKYFLVCMKELRNKNHWKPRILVSLLMGQHDYQEDDRLKTLIDGYHYGHLRKLQDVYFNYHHGVEKAYYLNMMKILCEPYTDVMKEIVLLCEKLFKKSESTEFSGLMGDVADNYLEEY